MESKQCCAGTHTTHHVSSSSSSPLTTIKHAPTCPKRGARKYTPRRGALRIAEHNMRCAQQKVLTNSERTAQMMAATVGGNTTDRALATLPKWVLCLP